MVYMQAQEEKRQECGYEIAKKKQVKAVQDGWLVESQSGNGFYKVSDTFVCDCPDSEFHKATCKHAYAVRYYLDIERHTKEGVKNERIGLTYKQAWSVYNQAQTSEGKLFDELLADLVKEVRDPRPIQIHGRPHLDFNIALFVAIKKVYSQMSSRRSMSIFGVAKEKGYLENVPHFNTMSVLLNRGDITPILYELMRITSAPLKAIETDFAVDSSGFATRSFGAYAENKYGTKKARRWLKAHICVGVKTNIVTGIEITDESGADSPRFIPLMQQTAQNGFKIREASGDKAYLSRDNLAYIEQLEGIPYIPFKENSKSKPHGSHIWRKMFHYFEYNKDEFLQHYHKRSNVETTFSAVKKKLGETLKSKNHTAQVNELLCKFIAYNILVLIEEMHELGIKPKFNNGDGYASL
jgi:transposase